LGNLDRASSANYGGGGGTDLRDGSTAIDGKSGKAHATERVRSTPLNAELISGSHEKFNSLVMEVIILIIRHVRRASN